MKILNHTQIDDDVIRAMVSLLTKGISRKISRISVSYTRKERFFYHGRCFFSSPCIITVAVSGNGAIYPFTANAERDPIFHFPKYEIRDLYENLLQILAHEIYHLRAYLHKWKNTECRAERYTFKILEDFRSEFWSV